ncbi:MAG TPA: hypothetical protein VHI32_07420 [Burkholderiales bacterium]|nr:hypothetical protein [Burkholderiales bacterium]
MSGVVVETVDGDVTNIGHVCGGKYFEEFQRKKNEYDMRAAHSRRVRALKDFLNYEPIVRRRIDTLRTQPLGADWLHTSYRNFFSSAPAEVVNHLRERARRNEVRVTRAERVTNEDEADRIRQLQGGLSRGRSAKDPVFVEREIGRLRGLGIWKDGQTIGDLLHEGIVGRLDALRPIDPHQLRSHALRAWADWAESIDTQLAVVERLIPEGREFFKDENLALLARMPWSRGTEEALKVLRWDYAAGVARNPSRPKWR